MVFVTPSSYPLFVDKALYEVCSSTRRLCDGGFPSSSVVGEQRLSKRDICKALTLPAGQVPSAALGRHSYPTLCASWAASVMSEACFSRRFGMPRISFDEAMSDDKLYAWRSKVLASSAAEMRTILPIRSILFVFGMTDPSSAEPSVITHVFVIKHHAAVLQHGEKVARFESALPDITWDRSW